MIAEKMKEMVANSSAIRAMFEEGNRLAQIYGPENVYDFSLGNPNIPAPEALTKAMKDVLLEEDPVELHGYTNSNAGRIVWIVDNHRLCFGGYFFFKLHKFWLKCLRIRGNLHQHTVIIINIASVFSKIRCEHNDLIPRIYKCL